MRDIPTNSDNVIDSRDVIKRIEELEEERERLSSAVEEAQETLDDFNDPTSTIPRKERTAQKQKVREAKEALIDWDEGDEGQEYKALKSLQDEAEGYCDWRHGATLIAESHFVAYAEDLCKEIGDLPRDLPDYLVIDWNATAENLKEDYTEVDFDGTTYLVRE